jgi:hypothetical protein
MAAEFSVVHLKIRHRAALAFWGGNFSIGFGNVPISSTEQMPIP